MRIHCGTFSFSVWVFELELENVANVKISSSNVANFQLGIGIGIGNISTLATFTSVGVGEWNHRPTRDRASLTLARLETRSERISTCPWTLPSD